MTSQLPEAKSSERADRYLVLGTSPAGGLYEMG